MMEKSFDLGSMLKRHQKKHKSKPLQFESVTAGIQRRLDKNLKYRKSSRLTSFDCARNLPEASPEPPRKDPERRRQQLEKWKEEKERKKKMEAQSKKKPFISAATQHSHPLKYVPPPPIRPSTSGCVTRSQARNKKDDTKHIPPPSFAPKNATFKAPEIKMTTKMPKMSSGQPVKDVTVYKLNLLPATKSVAQRPRSARVEAQSKNAKPAQVKPQVSKPATHSQKNKKPVLTKSSKMLLSSSSSDCETTIVTKTSSSQDSASSSDNNNSSKSLRSQQSSTDDDLSPMDKTPSHTALYFTSSSDSEKQSPVNKQRHSLSKISTSKSNEKSKKEQKKNISKTPENHKKEKKEVTPKNGIPKSESSSEEKLRSPKSPTDAPCTPQRTTELHISPCVTLSRGKENARREMKKKMEEGLFEEDDSELESVEHFQRLLDTESKRLLERCDQWDLVLQQLTLPEPVQEMILAAVGQGRLLVSQKMQQFAALVRRCARPAPDTPAVTPQDLQGFWDMLYMQVENVDMRFKTLEELRARNWAEAAPPALRPRARARPAARPRAAAPASKIRDIIAAARKAKAQGAPPPEEKTFEAGFFSVRSPARSPARTPVQRDRASLLKAVLSNEAEKASASKKSASMAMLRASVLSKSMEGVEPLPQTPLPDLNATPARSILKQPQESAKNPNRHIRIVLFDDISHTTNCLHKETKLTESQTNSDKGNSLEDNKQVNGKENSKPRLSRQNAVRMSDCTEAEASPRRASRRTRKTIDTPTTVGMETHDLDPGTPKPRRSTRKNVLAESNVQEKTPRRSSRRRQTDVAPLID